MRTLNIDAARERAAVTAADLLLGPVGSLRRAFRRRQTAPLARILVLRLERIGDLIMTLPALALLRTLAPDAAIDLVVGGWNAPIARAIPGIDHVETMDARWLARDGRGANTIRLLAAATRWRSRRYDLAIDFEPDIRTNLILAASGARRLAGFASGGGGPLLDVAVDYDTGAHTSDNAVRLVQQALDSRTAAPPPRLALPETAVAAARDRLRGAAGRVRVGLHASGGRAIKQWPPERFGEVARALAARSDAVIVLTGASSDRPIVDVVKQAIPADRAIDLCGELDLLTLAAVIGQLDLFITGDTGPMHVAAAAGTPVVAVFGPSDPARYGPHGPFDRIVRVDLPCAPCNRIRQPPARCVGHTPDCLAGITAGEVVAAAEAVLRAGEGSRRVRAAE